MSRSSKNRFRPFNQFISSGSRAARQATKALLRANRNDAKWMARFQKQQARLARWKAAFGRFVPLNISRFRAVIGVMMGVVASLCSGRTLRTRPAFANRSGMISFGSNRKNKKNRKSARVKSKSADSHGYSVLEPRQLLAADITAIGGDNLINSIEQVNLTVVGTADPGANVEVSVPGSSVVPVVVMADSTTGNFTTAGSGFDVSSLNEGLIPNFTAAQVDGMGIPDGSSGDTASARKDTTADGDAMPLSVTIDDGGDGLVSDNEMTAVTFTVDGIDSDATGTVVFTDGTNTQAATIGSPVNLSALNDGPITATVTATDTAGNMATATDASVLDTTADGDATPLSVTINDGDGSINADEVDEVEFTVAGVDVDATASVEFTDGSTILSATIGSPVDLSTLNGLVTATVTATDTAGNTASATDGSVVDVSADADAPTLSVTIDDGDGVIDASEATNVAFTVAGLDADATAVVTFSDNTDALTAMVTADGAQTPINLSSLADGPITATIVATDTALNTATASDDSDKDAAVPSVAVSLGAGQTMSTFDLPVVFNVTFSEGVSGFDPADLVIDGTAVFTSGPTATVTSGVSGDSEYEVTVSGIIGAAGTVTLSVPAGIAIDDATNENLASPTAASVSLSARAVSIEANDSLPIENQFNNAQFTVSLDDGSPVSTGATRVRFTINSDSTAELGPDPQDFIFGPQVTDLRLVDENGDGIPDFPDQFSVLIPGEASAQVIDIDLQDDVNFDPDETIILNIVGFDNDDNDLFVVGATGSDTITIRDNETRPTVTVSANDSTAAEGDPTSTSSGQFTISLSTPVDSDTTVVLDITQASNSSDANDAVNNVDYTFSGTALQDSTADTVTVLIPAFASSVTLNVNPIAEDSLVELTELIELTPASATQESGTGPIAIGNDSAVVNVTDDDTATVSIESTVTTDEGGTEPEGTLTFTLTDPASTDTTVAFTQTGTADYGVDYWLDIPVVEIEANNSRTTTAQDIDGAAFNLAANANIANATTIPHVTILGLGDNSSDFYQFTVPQGANIRIESDSVVGFGGNVQLRLGSGNNSNVQTSSNGLLIRNNVTAGTYTVRVRDLAAGNVPLGASYQLHVSIEDHATPTPTTVTIPAGTTVLDIPISIVDDAILEDDESVRFQIPNGTVVGIDGDISADSNINDRRTDTEIIDNELATVSINGGLNAIEDNVSTNGTFVISSNRQSDIPITVPFEVTEPSVIGQNDSVFDVDYTFSSNVTVGTGANAGLFFVTLPANTNNPSVTIQVIPINEATVLDTDVEQNETIRLTLVDNAFNALPANRDDSLQYDATTDGDTDVVIGTASDTIIIQDTDLAVVTVNSSIDTAVEGGADGEWEIVLVSRDTTIPMTDPVTPLLPIESNTVVASSDTVVTYEIVFVDPTPPSTAQPGQPATPADIDTTSDATTTTGVVLTGGTITIPAGQERVFLPLSAIDDGMSEGTEEVFLRILEVTSGDSDIAIADPSTNADDDVIFIQDAQSNTVKISVTPDVVDEEVGTVNFTVELVGAPLVAAAQAPITVNYSVTGSATSTLDFEALSGSVVIPAGATPSATISVNILEDTIIELDETITITIDSIEYAGPAAITIDNMDSDTLRITEDDIAEVVIDATDQFAGEGQDDGQFTVSLRDSETGLPVTSSTGVLVNYSTIFPTNPSPNTPHATEGVDYSNLPGSINILPNQSSASFSVNVIDDSNLEGTERVVVQLDDTGSPSLFTVSAPSGPTDGTGGGFIGNQDYVLIAADQEVSVGSFSDATEGGTTGAFEVSINRTSTTDTFVTYTLSTVADPTTDAGEGADFVTTTGMVTIPANQLSALVIIDATTVGDDFVIEGTEEVTITLMDVTNTAPDVGADITIGTNDEETLAIFDDDAGFVTVAGTTNAVEGTTDGQFTVTLRDRVGNPTTSSTDTEVTYFVTGTATNGLDYQSLPLTVTIPAGSPTEVIDIDVSGIFDDIITEGIETVTITLDEVLNPPTDPDIFIGAIGGPEVTFQQGVNGYTGTEDIFIDQDSPATNNDGDGIFSNTDTFFGGPASTEAQHGALRFDGLFDPNAIFAGSTIGSAELSVFVPPSVLGVAGGDINLHFLNTQFSESLDWLSSASVGNFIPGIQPDGLDASIAFQSYTLTGNGLAVGGVNENILNVTQFVQQWSDGRVNDGFAVLPGDTANGTNFLDSEFGVVAFRPQLTVTIDPSATITITDNDETTIDITGNTAGQEQASPNAPINGVVEVTLSTPLPPGHTVTVNYSVEASGSSNAATPFSDFTPVIGSFDIAAGDTTGTFEVPVLEDDLNEGIEDVLVRITGFSISGSNAAAVAANVSLGTTTDLVDIVDNDMTEVTVTVQGSGTETPGTGSGLHSDSVFRVSIDRTSTAPTEVSYTLSSTDSDFVFGSDIATTTITGTVTIPAGAEFVDFTVNVLDDLINEDEESFTFTLDSVVSSNPGITIATGSDSFAMDTIQDDDDLVADVDTSADPTADESRFPTTSDNTGTFTISLNFASDRTTTVPFRVTVPFSNAAALPSEFNTDGNPEGADYELIAGTGITWVTPTTGFATFGPSASPQSTTITLVATQDFDPTEVNEFARIAIVDTISAPGADPALFNPNRPADFLDPFDSGGFRPDNVDGAGNFAAVEIIDEDFVVSLDPTDSPALEDGPPISGFDGQFTVLISNPTQVGNTVTVPFSVVSDSDISGIQNGSTTTTATYGEDYVFTAGTLGSVVTVDPDSIGTGTVTGTVTIPGGQTQALITIEVDADNVVEGEFSTAAGAGLEDIALTLGTPVVSTGSIATLDTAAASGIQRIIDNDEADVNVSVIDDLPGPDPAGIREDGNDGGFLFTLNNAAQGRDVRIDFVVRGTSTATDGSDFVFGPSVLGSGTPADPYHIIIPAGQTEVTAVIEVLADIEAEGNESVNVEITAVTALLAGTTTIASTPAIDGGTTLLASAIIQDDDRPTVSVFAQDADASEETNPGILEFTLSQPSATPVTVTYTVGGDANTGTIGNLDYVPLPGTVTFPAGETSVEVVVQTLPDDVVEDNETVIVTLVEETSSPLVTAVGEATVVIASDDVATATLSREPGDNASETNPTGAGQGQFTVTLDNIVDEDVTISLSDVTPSGLGFATPADFGTTASVTIPAGQLTGTVSVTPVDDSIAEGPETLTFELNEVIAPVPFQSPVVAGLDLIVLDSESATMTISDNDVPVFLVDSISEDEGLFGTIDDLTGTTTYTFTVSHNATTLAEDVVITPSLLGVGLGGTATTAGPQNFGQDDFDFTDGIVPVLTFVDGGPTSQTFTVDVFHDIVQEADEAFTVSLSADTVGPLLVTASDTGTGTILNDDFVEYTIVQTNQAIEGTDLTFPYREAPLSTFPTVTFEITPSIPVDINIPIRVDYVSGTGVNGAVGANFQTTFNPNGTQSLPFGTDFDNGRDSDTFTVGSTTATTPAATVSTTVAVVQDVIVEGAPDLSSGFGVENFTTNLSTTAATNTARPGITFVNETAAITDDDGQVFEVPGNEIDPVIDVLAIVSVSASDPLNDPDSTAIGALDASEPGAPFGDGEFTFSVSTPVQEDIVISYSFTVDGAMGDPNGDLGADTTDDNPDNPLGDPSTGRGTITIPGSSTTPITSVTLPFSVFNDAILEDDEDVVITITGIETDRNVDFSTESAAVTIQDDDRALISIATLDGVATEGSTTDTATFRISISQVSDTPTTVGLALRGSTGDGLLSDVNLTSGDYSIAGLVSGTRLPNSVTIPANTPFVDIVVTGLQDVLTEGPEDLAVELIDDENLGIFGNGDIDIDTDNDQAEITILDDGDGFTVNAEFVRDGNEPGTGTTDDGIFRIQLRDAFGEPAIVPFGSTDGGGLVITYTVVGTNLVEGTDPANNIVDPNLDAAEPDDFTANAFTVVIAEGESFANVNINVSDDLEAEDPETVELTVTSINNTGGVITTLAGETIATGQASDRLDIIDNDAAAVFIPGDADLSGTVDFSDISPFISLLSRSEYLAEADLNGDDRVDFNDISLFISQLANGGRSAATGASTGTSKSIVAEPPKTSFVYDASVAAPEPVALVASPAKTALPTKTQAAETVASAPLPVAGSSQPSGEVTTEAEATPVDNYIGPVAITTGESDSTGYRNSSSNDSKSKDSLVKQRSMTRNGETIDVSDESRNEQPSANVTTADAFSTAAELFDTHPELLDGAFDFELEDTFAGLE